jgi:sodium/bile acid cotransporter 7
MNSVAMPLLTWLIVATVGWQLLGRELALGLLAAVAVPCTLASAAVWTRRAGGNDAVSIMVTVITNATCFLVTPFWLVQTTGQQAQLDAGPMITKLALVVVVPMTLAQLARLTRPVGRWALRRKTPLGVVAQTGVLAMVFFGSVQTAQRFGAGSTPPAVFALITLLVAVVGIHVLGVFAGMWAARLAGCDRGDQIAVGLAGSQKTLMVGLQVAMESGFNIIPMVAYHICQLLIDTLIADRLRRRGGSEGVRG